MHARWAATQGELDGYSVAGYKVEREAGGMKVVNRYAGNCSFLGVEVFVIIGELGMLRRL